MQISLELSVHYLYSSSVYVNVVFETLYSNNAQIELDFPIKYTKFMWTVSIPGSTPQWNAFLDFSEFIHDFFDCIDPAVKEIATAAAHSSLIHCTISPASILHASKTANEQMERKNDFFWARLGVCVTFNRKKVNNSADHINLHIFYMHLQKWQHSIFATVSVLWAGFGIAFGIGNFLHFIISNDSFQFGKYGLAKILVQLIHIQSLAMSIELT